MLELVLTRSATSLVPRLPPCFYLACGRNIDFSTAGEIKARGKPGDEANRLASFTMSK